jgi:hypothetical protein
VPCPRVCKLVLFVAGPLLILNVATISGASADDMAPTLTSMTATPNPSMWGAPMTFVATVVSDPVVPSGAGCGSNGTVSFSDGENPLGTVMVTPGTNTYALTVPLLDIGHHLIGATFNGGQAANGRACASSGTTLFQTVNAVTTTTVVTSSSNPSVWGKDVALTAVVRPSIPESITVDGPVTFRITSDQTGDVFGCAASPTVALSEGKAVCDIPLTALEPGSYHVVATYGGAATFAPSSDALVQQVNRAASALALAASVQDPVGGQSVTFIGTVTEPGGGSGVPTGVVSFFLGNGSPMCTSPLDTMTQTASCTVSSLAPSATPYVVSATYSGDNHFVGSSASITESVKRVGTDTSLGAIPAQSALGQPVTLRAQVTADPAAVLPPSGSVAFYAGSRPLGTAPLDGGSPGLATLTTTALPAGNDVVTAVYLGDANLRPSTSPGTLVVVAPSSAPVSTASVASVASPTPAPVLHKGAVTPVAPAPAVAPVAAPAVVPVKLPNARAIVPEVAR